MHNGKEVHFFGFRGDEYNRAIKVFGQPDFIHPIHDYRAYVDFDPVNDIGIFANKETPERISNHRREYVDMMKLKDRPKN